MLLHFSLGLNKQYLCGNLLTKWSKSLRIAEKVKINFKNSLTSNKSPHFYILKTFKLFGFSIGPGAFLLRTALCKNSTNRATQFIQTNYKQYENYGITFSEFWTLIRPYIHWLILATLGALLTALLNIKIPILLGELVNIIAEFLAKDGPGNFRLLNSVAINLMVLYVAQACSTFLYIICLSLMGERMAADLRVRLFNHILHFDMSFFDQQRSGELSDRLNFDVQEFKSSFKACVSQGLRTLTQTTGCIISLYLISPTLTIFTVGLIPVVVLVGTGFGALLRKISQTAQIQNGIVVGIASEAFQNIRTVKECAMEPDESNIYKEQVEKSRILNERLGAGIGAFQAATNVFLNGLVLGILYGGSQLVIHNNISPGDLISFLVTSQTIQRSLTQLSLVFGNAIKGYTSVVRINQFLKIQPGNTFGTLKIPYHSLLGEIDFENVNFEYPSRPSHPVLNNLNLKIGACQTVALCGPSGCGKSTIAALIERLYNPQSGHIKLDGVDLKDLNPDWLRRNVIGIISQEPILFATTIEENIRYGKSNATSEEVKKAARLANADIFIQRFPNGYNTVVGERGVALSGGQKQRIAIARALLKDPPILILDEATSALDSESEKQVQEALERVMKNRTVIVIAHRLSTIQNADLICVIKDGTLVEKGHHKELMRKGGYYYDLVNLQQKGFN